MNAALRYARQPWSLGFVQVLNFCEILSRQEGGLNRFLRIMTQKLHTALRNQRNGDAKITKIRPHLLAPATPYRACATAPSARDGELFIIERRLR